jgi:hypothetical protein
VISDFYNRPSLEFDTGMLFVVDNRKLELLDSFNSLRILDRRISVKKTH